MAPLMKGGLLLVIAALGTQLILSDAEVYTVGDSTEWTTLNHPNYTAWASNKTFHVGDTLLFKYNKLFHNVLEVSKADYDACKNASAIETFATGDDSVAIKTAGHHYYLCGVPGHCQVGQKVDILAVGGTGAAAPASSAAPSLLPPGTPAAPTSNLSAPPPSAGARSQVLSLTFGIAATSYVLVYLH